MAEFDDKYLKKIEKDLTKNDIKATAGLYVDNPLQPWSFRLHVRWSLEDQFIGEAWAHINTDTGVAFFPGFFIDQRYQGKGLYTAYVDHAIREWPKRGITIVQAAWSGPLSRTILKTNGFEDPADSLDTFKLDLKGARAKEFRAWIRGDEEPEWRVEHKQEIAALQRQE